MTGLTADDRLGIPGLLVPGTGRRGLQRPECREGDAHRAPALDDHRDAIVRLREFGGHEVIRRNHLGG